MQAVMVQLFWAHINVALARADYPVVVNAILYIRYMYMAERFEMHQPKDARVFPKSHICWYGPGIAKIFSPSCVPQQREYVTHMQYVTHTYLTTRQSHIYLILQGSAVERPE